MKRTNLVLDENLLKTATRVLGAKTYSAAVNQALDTAIRLAKAREITQFFGSGAWEGDLAEMRSDRKRAPSRARRGKVR